MSAIEKISDGKKEVDSSYYLGSGIYVTCPFPYTNVSIRLWTMANGRKYATPQVFLFRFNEWNEFIKVAQKMYSEYSEIYNCEPCILDQDSSGMMLIHVRSARLILKPHAGVRLQRTFHFNWKSS